MEYRKIVSPSLKDLFIQEIEEQILSEKLKIGEKLPPEREIAQNMNISRSVVNSGISEMERKGFLVTVPRQGTYVADFKSHATPDILVSIMKYGSLSHDYIRSTLEIREIFMCTAIEKAIPQMTDEQLCALEEAFEAFSLSASPAEGADCLCKIDCLLAEYSGNLLMPIILASFKKPNAMLFERYLRLYGSENMKERNRMLLEQMKARDAAGAVQTMRESILETLEGTRQIY